MPLRSLLSSGVRATVRAASTSAAAALAAAVVVMWAVIGAVSGFGHHWFDVLYASTSGVTFVMVFLIQHTSGRETRAILVKLDELLRASDNARDEYIAAEHRPLHEQDHLESAHRDSVGQ